MKRITICPACGGELQCLRCHLSRAGEIGGSRRTPARLAAAQAASRAPRPTRRVYDLSWTPSRRGLPERASLAEAVRQATSRRASADLVREGRVVGRVEPDGSWTLV